MRVSRSIGLEVSVVRGYAEAGAFHHRKSPKVGDQYRGLCGAHTAQAIASAFAGQAAAMVGKGAVEVIGHQSLAAVGFGHSAAEAGITTQGHAGAQSGAVEVGREDDFASGVELNVACIAAGAVGQGDVVGFVDDHGLAGHAAGEGQGVGIGVDRRIQAGRHSQGTRGQHPLAHADATLVGVDRGAGLGQHVVADGNSPWLARGRAVAQVHGRRIFGVLDEQRGGRVAALCFEGDRRVVEVADVQSVDHARTASCVVGLRIAELRGEVGWRGAVDDTDGRASAKGLGAVVGAVGQHIALAAQHRVIVEDDAALIGASTARNTRRRVVGTGRQLQAPAVELACVNVAVDGDVVGAQRHRLVIERVGSSRQFDVGKTLGHQRTCTAGACATAQPVR